MSEHFLAEDIGVKPIIGGDFATAQTGARVDVKNFERVAFIVNLAAGAATTGHTFSIKQYQGASGGVSSPVSTSNPYYVQAAGATNFTKIQPTADQDTYDLHAILGSTAGVVIFEVLQENLAQGYRYVSLNTTATGAAQQGSVIAIGHQGKIKPAYSLSL